MKTIHIRDYKILAELDKNPKASFNHIGKKLRLSPSVVERRIKNLIKLKLIKSFLTIADYKKLGYTYYSIYARFQNITKNKRNEILTYLKEHPLSGQILQCDGRWQLIFGFFSKDIFHLNKELRKFNKLFGDYIRETEKIIHIGSHHYYRGYLLNKEITCPHEPFLGGKEQEVIELDKTNCRLLNSLRYNARINYVVLSKRLEINVEQTRYKIKKLNQDKIIIGHWLHLNPEKLNLHSYRILLKLKHLDSRSEQKLLYFMNINKNVIRANSVFGSWDFFIDLEIDPKGFRSFMEKFTKIFSEQIQEYETLMIYDEVKFTFYPLF